MEPSLQQVCFLLDIGRCNDVRWGLSYRLRAGVREEVCDEDLFGDVPWAASKAVPFFYKLPTPKEQLLQLTLAVLSYPMSHSSHRPDVAASNDDSLFPPTFHVYRTP